MCFNSIATLNGGHQWTALCVVERPYHIQHKHINLYKIYALLHGRNKIISIARKLPCSLVHNSSPVTSQMLRCRVVRYLYSTDMYAEGKMYVKEECMRFGQQVPGCHIGIMR